MIEGISTFLKLESLLAIPALRVVMAFAICARDRMALGGNGTAGAKLAVCVG